MLDVLIVGGGPAELNAALTLGRARYSVLLCDAGAPRNGGVHAMHNFLSRDGTDPAEIRAIGRAQLRPYDSVEVRDVSVESARRDGDGFAIALADGTQEYARKILLATGLVDELPAIDGLAPRWGHSVFNCPYCSGWEVRDQPLAVIGNGPTVLQFTLHLLQWSRDLMLCTNGPASLSAPEREVLAACNVPLREEPVVRLEGPDTALEQLVFATGPVLARRAAFLFAPTRQHSDLPLQLGCTMLDNGAVQVDDLGQTDVPGVYAAGDMARRPSMPFPGAQVVVAAAAGVVAAVGIDRELAIEHFSGGPLREQIAAQAHATRSGA